MWDEMEIKSLKPQSFIFSRTFEKSNSLIQTLLEIEK